MLCQNKDINFIEYLIKLITALSLIKNKFKRIKNDFDNKNIIVHFIYLFSRININSCCLIKSTLNLLK
jgi:hypothetical protein